METRNRTILLIVLGIIMVVACCCILLGGATLAGLIALRASSAAGQVEDVRPVVLVTPGVTPAPSRSPRPAAQPSLQPDKNDYGSPTLGALVPPTNAAPDQDSNAQALQAKAEMPARDLRDLALRLKPGLDDIPVVVNPTPPAYKVGDTARFWVENSDTQEHRQITATLAYMTDHAYMWVEQGVRLDLKKLKRSADRFESQTYPTDRAYFGSEWTPGVDNDVHLSILHARGLGESIAGYYSSADEFSRLINPYSNEREMFYISADDDKVSPDTPFYDGVLAHEFQHMIHWASDRHEDSWVNEGMSELAGHLNGFDTGGSETLFADHPDTQLTTWNDPSEGNGEHYGASYLFADYFLHRFGEGLTKTVISSQESGVAGFNDALAKAGRPERFDDIFADWVVANYLNDPEAAPKGHYGYEDLDPPQPTRKETYRRFPVSFEGDLSQYGADYIELRGADNLSIDFTGAITVGLVSAQPHGRYAWWSNRGDDSDVTLTRPFDLAAVSSATLTFSAWYNIEDGWDYLYVEASADGGEHWQVLPGKHTTAKNPVGNAFGPGWTGISGDGKTPRWISEQVSLDAYAGKQILLRFEYVTDDAVNGPGFLLDDLAIPELKYQDGGENGQGGWQPAGWLLTDNKLAQQWLVQLVTSDEHGVQLQRMQVGPDGRGHLTVNDADRLRQAMLIVSPLAPVTTEKAAYRFTITSRQ